VVICLERDADLHIAQLMLLPRTVSCFSKIQIGFTFLVLAHPDGPGQRAVKRMCVCVCVCVCVLKIIVIMVIIILTYHNDNGVTLQSFTLLSPPVEYFATKCAQ